ncbi:FHA domain-containing protein [Streptomyces sp. BI20]|uniref:FHA domain-containing protein n=1 Tax=Streptomyces sp. BI20 TaxID=3403460 RepID=UPI003C70AF52
MPTCPNGHQSVSDDWCEFCGHRIGGAAGAAAAAPAHEGYGYPPAGGDATAQAELCPQCRTPREAMAPFCEECRFNFLTRTATSYTPIAPDPQQGRGLGPSAPPPPPSGPHAPQQHGGPHPGQPQHGQPQHGGQQHGQPQHGGQHAQPQHGQHQSPSQHGAYQPPPPPQTPPQHQPGDPYGTGSDASLGYGGPAAPPAPPHQTGGGHLDPDAYEYQGSRPSRVNRHAEPLAPSQDGDDWLLPPPGGAQQPPYPGQNQGYGQQQGHPQQGQQQGQGAEAYGHAPIPQSPYQQQPQQQPQPPQAPQPPAPASNSWSVTIGPDRDYFLAMMQRSGPEAAGLNLPAYSPEQHIRLTGGQLTIGRRRASTGESPDVDLSVPPEDPGVSHKHAVLVRQPDGSWAVVDQESTNGTTINGGEDPIQPFVPIPLRDGDRVHVGAWTTLTIRVG